MIYKRPFPMIQGWMSISELQWLYNAAKKYKSIVEVGVWKGRATHALCMGTKDHGGTVASVDHFQGTDGYELNFFEVLHIDIYSIFMSRLGQFANLKVYRMKSEEAAPYIDEAEMIFLDGDHSYEEVKKDLELWGPKTTKIICGHDYRLSFPGVKKAVMEVYGVPKVVDSIWYVEVDNGKAKEAPGVQGGTEEDSLDREHTDGTCGCHIGGCVPEGIPCGKEGEQEFAQS